MTLSKKFLVLAAIATAFALFLFANALPARWEGTDEQAWVARYREASRAGLDAHAKADAALQSSQAGNYTATSNYVDLKIEGDVDLASANAAAHEFIRLHALRDALFWRWARRAGCFFVLAIALLAASWLAKKEITGGKK